MESQTLLQLGQQKFGVDMSVCSHCWSRVLLFSAEMSGDSGTLSQNHSFSILGFLHYKLLALTATQKILRTEHVARTYVKTAEIPGR